MPNYFRGLIPACLLIASILAGCGSEEQKVPETTDTVSTESVADTGGIQIFTLPAPLQVATVMRLEEEPYVSSYLLPGSPPAQFPSNKKQALGLGVYLVDMGYACIYDQRQTSLNYAKAVEELMDDLGITSSIRIDMVNRFENNLRNNDSLYTIILESYGRAHNYFRDNGREEIGLFIMCGSYIEGLNIALQSKETLTNNRLRNLIGQQKIFLENILTLSGYMADKPGVQETRTMLEDLYRSFEGITVKVEESADGASAVNSNITVLQLKRLTEKVKSIRSRLIAA
jgi:hypothetical protein